MGRVMISAERIQKAIDDNGWRAWCTLTAINPNLGFTGGNNAILRPAMQSDDPPQYFLLLNADTIVRPNAFKALVDFMDQHPNVGIAGCRLEAAGWHDAAIGIQIPVARPANLKAA